MILVYDVSRWGRYQDVDQSAYYEFLCWRADIAVVYCAEAFAADAGPWQHLLKHLKRLMAAEFSRELSEKVLAAHRRLLQLGYKPGGGAGFGLQRIDLRADGVVRGALAPGERKARATDRVVLAPGDEASAATVRRIYQLYLKHGAGYQQLARWLNAEGRSGPHGGQWSGSAVRAVLTNEKYCGNLVYQRTTARMGQARRHTPSTEWLRHAGAHAAIVEPSVFAAAQRQYRLKRGLDRAAVLDKLREIFRRDGRLSSRAIDAEPGMPHTALVGRMFGGLANAFELAVGKQVWGHPSAARLIPAWVLLPCLCKRVTHCIERAGHLAEATRNTSVLLIDGKITLRVAVANCCRKGVTAGWRIPVSEAGTDLFAD